MATAWLLRANGAGLGDEITDSLFDGLLDDEGVVQVASELQASEETIQAIREATREGAAKGIADAVPS